MQNVTALAGSDKSDVTCSCNCTSSQPQGMDISELEFVQIVLIVVVMTVMVLLIICLLNHHKISTFVTTQTQAGGPDRFLQQDGCLWPSDCNSRQGVSEVLYAPPARDGFTASAFVHRDRFSRFQPTYPFLQHQINLPPTISLSDGEEPPPYQGPCTLQLRDPEQQMELNRESVRAPPNRTIYDSDLIDRGGEGSGGAGGPRPPSSNSGISVANSSSHRRLEGPPPPYSEVISQYSGLTFFLHQQSNNQRMGEFGGPKSRTIQQQNLPESTIMPAQWKGHHPEDSV
ncbi:low-density lipoprotein receptor class A domain-containing protein 4-like isoform X1 [Nerophis lumbriciformis]|uniref:low-density lipoprotein receptor class A domain-containing protein 4-like isoform X1 n=1 Tax=Nerophis lumbriciformis TaxID=546530 RepID=UPI002AE06762|nr:low-density lipoprotein receptor class A domain-containing protein 4-like [Nerophis lumbriciformis]